MKRSLKTAALIVEAPFVKWCTKANKLYELRKDEIAADECYREMVAHDLTVLINERKQPKMFVI